MAYRVDLWTSELSSALINLFTSQLHLFTGPISNIGCTKNALILNNSATSKVRPSNDLCWLNNKWYTIYCVSCGLFILLYSYIIKYVIIYILPMCYVTYFAYCRTVLPSTNLKLFSIFIFLRCFICDIVKIVLLCLTWFMLVYQTIYRLLFLSLIYPRFLNCC